MIYNIVNLELFFEYSREIFSCFFSSFLIASIIILTKNNHINYTKDIIKGPQKIHKNNVPRIGGIAIILSLFLQFIFFDLQHKETFLLILLAGLPILIFGLAEDIAKNVSPMYRLIASYVSGTLATYWINLKIVSTHIVFIDITLSIWFVPFFLAILSIALLSQSLNIIDGLNGLALGASIVILMSTIYLGLLYKDKEIVYLSILFVSCFIGIFIINFSTGKIFIGDGGAYFIGYVCASLILMLSMRNQAISPFAILLIVIFPIYETLRSFLRRVFSKKSKYFEADDRHLHSKLYVFISSYFSNKKKMCNSTSSFLILIGLVFFSFLAIKFHQNDSILILLLFLFIFLYETILKIISLNFKKT